MSKGIDGHNQQEYEFIQFLDVVRDLAILSANSDYPCQTLSTAGWEGLGAKNMVNMCCCLLVSVFLSMLASEHYKLPTDVKPW